MKHKIAIIVSNFYPKISKKLIIGAVSTLKKNKFNNFKIITVPGTFEIPFIISNLINKYKAFIVLGCVIKGKTPHFNFLCNSVFHLILHLSVKSRIPISNGILTCNNMKQAIKRADPNTLDKGGYAASAIISILNHIK